jgi:hypothetical protein
MTTLPNAIAVSVATAIARVCGHASTQCSTPATLLI